MATRNIVVTAATVGQVRRAELQNEGGGAIRIVMDVAAPGSQIPDTRNILLADTSLTQGQQDAFVAALITILGDLTAQSPAYA